MRGVRLDLRGAQDPQGGWDFLAERAGRDQLDPQVHRTDSLMNVFLFGVVLFVFPTCTAPTMNSQPVSFVSSGLRGEQGACCPLHSVADTSALFSL